jgi:hypothetical protein
MLWLVAMAAMWCQGTVGFESGVAKFESGDAWVMGPSGACTPQTVLSPDGSGRGRDRIRVHREEGKAKVGRTVGVPSTTTATPESCRPTYRVRTVDITFSNGEKRLSKEHQGRLAALAMDIPDGVSVLRYVEPDQGRNSQEISEARVAAVRTYFERILATRPGFTEEQLPAADQEAFQRIAVTAIYRSSCNEHVAASQESRRPMMGLGGRVGLTKEGTP